ncbi:hypothetical protein AbraIFM66950_000247 [Aspergillus brasiliensis]|nr:hypothetical protein AbraIFM66950_000247 [Aspergillus brasiliensis]
MSSTPQELSQQQTQQQQQHIPAWKKMGLKLKNAKDTVEETGAKRGEVDKKQQDRKKSKKRRLEDDDDEGKEVKEDDAEKKKKKKKRVSFSADAKKLDGDAEDQEEEQEQEQEQDQMKVDADAEGDGDKADDEGEGKKKKKEKKKKSKKQDGSNDASSTSTTPRIHETPILSYLSLYHKHRSAWKFQKNRETHLFKHVLSLEQVPTLYNAALLAYLQGLKSEGAKLRLRQIAEEVIKAEIDAEEDQPSAPAETEESKEGEEANEGSAATDKASYDKAVGVFRTRLAAGQEDIDCQDVTGQLNAETLKKYENRARAELVLFAVNGTLFNYHKPKPVGQKGKKAAQNQPGKKKKKNRTAIVEISSSSESESSSDSDSDSDSDDEKKTKAKPTTAKASSSKDSSDSDSSSSSSDSDSDSDSSSSSD